MGTILSTQNQQIAQLSAVQAAIQKWQEDRSELESKAFDLNQRAAAISVHDHATREQATVLMREGAGLLKELDKLVAPAKSPAYDLWKSFTIVEGDIKKEIGKARLSLEPQALAYDSALAAAQAVETARLARIAREQAEQEQLAEAIRLEALGATEEAEQVISAPTQVQEVYVPPAPKQEGESTRRPWVIDEEHIDLMALAKAVVDGKVLPLAISANVSWLKKQASANGEHFNVPGVRAFQKSGLTIRS